MVYAGGRPLWQMSIALHAPPPPNPVPVLRWSPTMHRRAENIRDRLMRGVGTSEPFIEPVGEELAMIKSTRQWRKPLSIEEINRMAPTLEVRARPGRP